MTGRIPRGKCFQRHSMVGYSGNGCYVAGNALINRLWMDLTPNEVLSGSREQRGINCSETQWTNSGLAFTAGFGSGKECGMVMPQLDPDFSKMSYSVDKITQKAPYFYSVPNETGTWMWNEMHELLFPLHDDPNKWSLSGCIVFPYRDLGSAD